jgi:hypothetical protein
VFAAACEPTQILSAARAKMEILSVARAFIIETTSFNGNHTKNEGRNVLPSAWSRSLVLHDAEGLVQKRGDTAVHDPVVDIVPFPPRGHDIGIREALELVRDSLRLHPQRFGEVCDADLTQADQMVEES